MKYDLYTAQHYLGSANTYDAALDRVKALTNCGQYHYPAGIDIYRNRANGTSYVVVELDGAGNEI